MTVVTFRSKKAADASATSKKLRLHCGEDTTSLPSYTHSLFPGAEYTEQEIEFLRRVEAYKKLARRKFPTFVEVFRIAREMLGET